jgi:hypothetical protein
VASSLPYNQEIMKNPASIKTEFATAEEAEAYDRWFHAKVQASLDDGCPTSPHEEVMAALRKIIEPKHDTNASDPMAS